MNPNHTLRYLNIGLPENILRLKLGGHLADAVRLIDRQLENTSIPETLRCCLIAQREICLRLPSDYPYTKSEALKLVQAHIPDFSEKEFDEREDAGKIGWIFLNNEKRYFGRFFETMMKTDDSIVSRIVNYLPGEEVPDANASHPTLLDDSMAYMKKHGEISNRIRICASLKVNDDVFSPEMFIRAHLPIPADCSQQSDIVIEKIEPAGAVLAQPDAPQRTVCWEKTMTENHSFTVEYSYTHTARYRDAYHLSARELAAGCTDAPLTEEERKLYTQEETPHITFTPYIGALVDSLTAGLEDPLDKARAFYDFITKNMTYTFMPEYFVLENISESCARNYTGDCGVFALLFITLCRCARIPACWQSGLCAKPDFCGCHDWARFYIDGAGWFYADPSFGVGSNRIGNEERRRFYFGNLDAYRMVANRAFQADFTPAKDYWRADPYDNQRGEMETDTQGLLYSEYERTSEIVDFTSYCSHGTIPRGILARYCERSEQ